MPMEADGRRDKTGQGAAEVAQGQLPAGDKEPDHTAE